jgi:hypothetical protein
MGETMTLRITIGCDPGNSGALAILADGEPAGFVDIPTMQRATKGNEVNCFELIALLRGQLLRFNGAHFFAVLERVNAMPTDDGSGKRYRIGGTTLFNFGESYGVLKCALAAAGIHYVLVQPMTWKKHFGLRSKKDGGTKDDARVLALNRYPMLAKELARKKDGGRADALLIGRWGWETEQHAQQAAA